MSSAVMMTTLNDVLATVTGRGSKPAMMWQDAQGAWKPISSDQLYGRVRALVAALEGWGVVKGDRVVILSENRWEWAVTDLAVMALGAADVPLYATTTAEHVAYMVNDSEAKIAVVSSKEQYAKLMGAELPTLTHVVVMDEGEFANAESFAAVMASAPGLEARDASFTAKCAEVKPEDLATLIYTSGTTGTPKGVMLTHENFAVNINVAMAGFDFKEGDRAVSFLPLSHVTARHVDYSQMWRGATIAYCPKFDLLPAAMQAVKPTIFVGVPRVYEKIRQAVEHKSAHSPVKSRILRWALKTGRGNAKAILAGKTPVGVGHKLADKLVYSKIGAAFGGSVRLMISGGAPLGLDSAQWFADAGMRIFEGYGLTETSPVISCNYPDAYRMTTVGKQMSNLEVRFAADGELEVKGPSVFHAYWKKPKETEEAFTADGFFKTGDIGNMDGDGYISITDRKKELLKTSGGKFVAPQPIENKLKANVLVAQAAMVGDKHKFVSVLLSPNFPALKSWAAAQGVSATDDKALVKDPKVVAEYGRIVESVNMGLAQYETMKRVCVVGEEWTTETGELTPSMKLKRRVVEKQYAAEIDAFYKDEASSKAKRE